MGYDPSSSRQQAPDDAAAPWIDDGVIPITSGQRIQVIHGTSALVKPSMNAAVAYSTVADDRVCRVRQFDESILSVEGHQIGLTTVTAWLEAGTPIPFHIEVVPDHGLPFDQEIAALRQHVLEVAAERGSEVRLLEIVRRAADGKLVVLLTADFFAIDELLAIIASRVDPVRLQSTLTPLYHDPPLRQIEEIIQDREGNHILDAIRLAPEPLQTGPLTVTGRVDLFDTQNRIFGILDRNHIGPDRRNDRVEIDEDG